MKSANMFRVLAFGDVIGDPGRKALFSILQKLKKKLEPDVTIINGENSAHGFGLNNIVVKALLENGIDVITTGNHVWQKKEIFDIIDIYQPLLRPLNYPPNTPGHGTVVLQLNGIKCAVINIMGRIFMDPIDCPFQAMDKEIARLNSEGVKIILVDFHAEATSEKVALAHYIDGRAAVVIGTHTHVQTADERILPEGTGFISDAGMVGYYDSVIGADKQQVLNLFLDSGSSSKKHDLPSEGEVVLNGVYLEISPKTRKCVKIERINEIIKIK